MTLEAVSSFLSTLFRVWLTCYVFAIGVFSLPCSMTNCTFTLVDETHSGNWSAWTSRDACADMGMFLVTPVDQDTLRHVGTLCNSTFLAFNQSGDDACVWLDSDDPTYVVGFDSFMWVTETTDEEWEPNNGVMTNFSKVNVSCTNIKSASGAFEEPCTQLKCFTDASRCRGLVHDRVCKQRPSENIRARCIVCGLLAAPGELSTTFHLDQTTVSAQMQMTSSGVSLLSIAPHSSLSAPANVSHDSSGVFVVAIGVGTTVVIVIVFSICIAIFLQRRRCMREVAVSTDNYGVLPRPTSTNAADVTTVAVYGQSSFSELK